VPRRQELESSITKKTVRLLKERWPGSKVVKIHGGPFQEKGLPDLHITLAPYGLSVWIEMKRPGRDAEPIQKRRIKEFIRAGGISFVATSPEEAEVGVREALSQWKKKHEVK